VNKQYLEYKPASENVEFIINLNGTYYFKFFENKTYLYIVMEFCEYGTLHDYIIKGGVLSEYAAANIMKQALQTINDLHTKYNIIHGDISLCNILVKNNNNHKFPLIKFIDFGMSEIIKYERNSYLLHYKPCVTAYYKAPEIVFHHPYNHSIDLWSMGVMMYTLLYGYPPFFVDPSNCKNKAEELRILDAKISLGFHPITISTEIFGHGPWHPSNHHISNEAKNLINRLLISNPSHRLTADQSLHHIWIIKNCKAVKTKQTFNHIII